jgi:hypothetical protein
VLANAGLDVAFHDKIVAVASVVPFIRNEKGQPVLTKEYIEQF